MNKNKGRKLIKILVGAVVVFNLLGQLAAADEILTDRSGNKIGSIVTQSNGILVARDRSGNKVGEYDPAQQRNARQKRQPDRRRQSACRPSFVSIVATRPRDIRKAEGAEYRQIRPVTVKRRPLRSQGCGQSC